MKVLVCGGRDYRDKATVFRTLYALCDEHNLWTTPDEYGNRLPTGIHIISGGAPGADTLAIDWAVVNWVSFTEYRADWNDIYHTDAVIRTRDDGTQYDALAGHRRNQKMLDEGKPDLVIGFPGGRGTADMLRRAKVANVKIQLVHASKESDAHAQTPTTHPKGT